MNRDARREFNRDSFDLWLVTEGSTNPTGIPGHPDTYHGRTGKPGSRVNQDDYWLEAISTPDARATDAFFRRTLASIAARSPETYIFFGIFYMPDPAAVERLRERIPTSSAEYSRERLIVRNCDAVVERVLEIADLEGRLLYWPSPDSAKGYVERNLTKKRDAIYMYHRERDADVGVEESVRRAVRFARCSRRAAYYWIRQQAKPEATPDTGVATNE